ncbi:hypothetical protein XF35_38965 [Streptomyces platensis subsp. clarensis]|uniref:Uncharacterized protein n=1 Tax=Streptomyces showdoensis TaxID=68268 RepID=A0A2P2GKU5_STREW|nr:hypothetical protein [Streptomyces showdoensis]KKZ72128.1 hypothetical protein VO63_20360 [Streptomyces showdoensis]MCW7991041.1 hypothetical protein [Streptomyces platensis subsp. clarensis]
MSTETLTRFRCDAPHCEANGIGHDNITPPDGWTKLKSTAHIPATTDDPFPGRRRTRTLSYRERCYGSFSLHLCPDHPNAFTAHQPITDGRGYKNDVGVSCSCGTRVRLAPAAHVVGRYPSHATEAAWFHHLPAELRWYLWRGQRQWATRKRGNGFDHIDQYPSEERARDAVASSSSLYYLPEVVYRDAEGDEWTVAPAEAEVAS